MIFSRHPIAGTCALLTLAFAGGLSCASTNCGEHNESQNYLHGVPVPQPAKAPGEGQLPPDETVASQTYSIELDGEFTLNQVTERKVAYLGADWELLDEKAAKRLGAEPFSGVLVRGVQREGPAWKAGLHPGDIIVSFGGKPVIGPDRLGYLLEQEKPGNVLDLEVLRGQEKVALKLELGSETLVVNSKAFARRLPVLDDRDRTGMRLAELTEDVRPIVLGPDPEHRGLLVLETLPGGPSFFADMRIRDCVYAVAGQPVRTLQEYREALQSSSPGDEVAFTILRDDLAMEKTIEIEEDATQDWGFNALGLVKYERSPQEREFGILWDILFNCESSYCVRRSDRHPQNATESKWGAILDLISYKSSPHSKELRLLWIFPISFRKG